MTEIKRLAKVEKAASDLREWLDNDDAPEKSQAWVLAKMARLLDGIEHFGLIELKRAEQFLSMARSFQVGRLMVEWRSEGKWAVVDCGCVLNSSGDWEFEPLNSGRTDEFLERTRFNLDTALEMARSAKENGPCS